MSRLNSICTRSLILTWVFTSIPSVPLSQARLRKSEVVVDDILEDDKFIAKYGNDNDTAGSWPEVRDIIDDVEKMKIICTQAHELFFKGTPKLMTIGFYLKQLNFVNSPQYHPMEVEVLAYTAEARYENPGTPYKFLLTKGLEPDCIYYLTPLDPDKMKVQLQEHVCGLKYKLKP